MKHGRRLKVIKYSNVQVTGPYQARDVHRISDTPYQFLRRYRLLLK